MQHDVPSLEARILRLERRCRRAHVLSISILVLASAAALSGMRQAEQSDVPELLRARAISLVDAEGRARVTIGAPIPEPPGRRGGPAYGMRINDAGGHERFGLTLKGTGEVGMGFDVAPGVGNPGNRERLNMGVNNTGQGFIRFLDNETRAKLLLYTDSDDEAWAEFLKWSDEGVVASIKYGLEQKTEPR